MCGKHQIWFSVSPNQSMDFFRDISLQWLTIIDGEKQKRQSTTQLKGDFADFQAVCIITVGVEYANVTLSIFPAPRAPLSFARKKTLHGHKEYRTHSESKSCSSFSKLSSNCYEAALIKYFPCKMFSETDSYCIV